MTAIDIYTKIREAFRATPSTNTMAEASEISRQTQKALADGPGPVQKKHTIRWVFLLLVFHQCV